MTINLTFNVSNTITNTYFYHKWFSFPFYTLLKAKQTPSKGRQKKKKRKKENEKAESKEKINEKDKAKDTDYKTADHTRWISEPLNAPLESA